MGLNFENLVKKGVSLKSYNTLQIEVFAEYFAEVSSVDEVKEVLNFAKQNSLPVLVIGGGSNLVLTRDWKGLVVHVKIAGIELIQEEKKNSKESSGGMVKIRVGAGVIWHDLVVKTVEKGWFGLENLALIPGTVGAAPVQNIGAYGKEVAEFVVAVEAIEVETGILKRFSNKDCKFGYRSSVFYGECPTRWLIVAVEFELSESPVCKIVYPALMAELEKSGLQKDRVNPSQVLEAVVRVRESKLPDPLEIPNVGSFFKNPIVSVAKFEELKAEFADLVAFEFGDGYKLAAGWLLEKSGFKGYVSQKGVAVYEKNALVLVNPLKLDGQSILELVAEIQAQVELQFGVQLEIEPLVV